MSRERLFGWPKLAARLDADLKRHFPKGDARLFTHNPELSSLVSYHKGGPVVINLAALTSRRFVRGLSQQQYVPREDLRGASGIYYGHDVDAAGHGLHHKFAEVKELPPIDIRHDGKLIMRYRVFLVRELK